MKIQVMNITILVMVFLASCKSSPTFSSWYDPWISMENLQDAITLREGEEPRIIKSNSNATFYEILSDHYICIGETSFNGPDEDYTNDIVIPLYKTNRVYYNYKYGIR